MFDDELQWIFAPEREARMGRPVPQYREDDFNLVFLHYGDTFGWVPVEDAVEFMKEEAERER